jgi:hypothetical protein
MNHYFLPIRFHKTVGGLGTRRHRNYVRITVGQMLVNFHPEYFGITIRP